MPANSQTFQDRMKPYWLLTGISIISGAIIFASYFIVRKLMPCDGITCISVFLIGLGLQWLLVVPATIVVVFVFKRLTRLNSLGNVYAVVLVGIPLIFNIFGANSFFITGYFYAVNFDKDRLVPNANFLQNFAFTSIKKEQLLYKKYDDDLSFYTYNAILQAENKTGVHINKMMFSLTGSGVDEAKHFGLDDNLIGVDGYWAWQGNDGIHMPSGNSEIEINIKFEPSALDCEKFKKPLALIYKIESSPTAAKKSIAIGDSISKELKQIACGSTP